jgi:hypothetical protein
MSRSNPFIRKPRYPNWTVLAVGEGETEKAFLQFLKRLYNKRGDGVSIRINYAGGGDPECVIKNAIKMTPRSFNQAFVVLDKDLPCRLLYINKARVSRLELIWCVPCIEGLFLKILIPGFDPSARSAAECKKLFEQRYLDENDKLDPDKYEKVFSFQILEIKRAEITELGKIISFMTERKKRVELSGS